MDTVVIDTSILLAIFNNEKGSDEAINIIPYSIISAVSVAESLGLLHSRYNVPLNEAKKFISQMVGNIIFFDDKQAMIVGELERINKNDKYGLSLADKACLALGKSFNLPIYTTDKIWSKLDVVGVKVIQIR